jgi:hypothetical protein
MDEVPMVKSVLFVGDYFSTMTTVVLNEALREGDEDDDEFAIRLATVLLEEFYGWDMEKAATVSIGVVED